MQNCNRGQIAGEVNHENVTFVAHLLLSSNLLDIVLTSVFLSVCDEKGKGGGGECRLKPTEKIWLHVELNVPAGSRHWNYPPMNLGGLQLEIASPRFLRDIFPYSTN
jgi:hypothetical protein